MLVARATLSRGLCLLGLFGSLTVAIWLPPFFAPDEAAHWYRAVHVSSGHILSRKQDGGHLGDRLPVWSDGLHTAITRDAPPPYSSMDRAAWTRGQAVRYTNEKHFVPFKATAIYPFTFYLPQAFALRVGRWLHAQPMTMFHCARAVNACVSWLTIWLAMRWAEELTLYWGALLLLPVVLQQLGTLSPDAGMIAAAVWLAALLRRAATAAPLQPRLLAAATAIVALLAQARPPLLGLLPLLWTPAMARHARTPLRTSRLRATLTVLLVAVPWFAGSLFWGERLRDDLPPVSARAAMLLQQPGEFLRLLWHTTDAMVVDYFWMLTGAMGWFDTPISRSTFDAACIGLATALCIASRRGYALKPLDALCVWVAIFGSYVGMQAIFYLTWTGPEDTMIQGFQGRYAAMFLPLVPLGLPQIPVPRWTLPLLEVITCLAMVRVVAAIPWTLLRRYYLCS